jgi:hypothetical protein
LEDQKGGGLRKGLLLAPEFRLEMTDAVPVAALEPLEPVNNPPAPRLAKGVPISDHPAENPTQPKPEEPNPNPKLS